MIKSIVLLVLSKLIKQPKYFLLVLLVVILWFLYNFLKPTVTGVTVTTASSTTYLGLPQIISGIASQGDSRILQNEGYVLAYSETLANPLWVTYYVGEKRFNIGKRPRFTVDTRSESKISHGDYTRSGYTRGHLAPNYVIASRYGKEAQKEAFLMTNISPQTARLNQKSWQRLEEIVANDFSEWHGGFWVITGPIFNQSPQTLKKTKIAIPDAFYKILIKPNDNSSSIIALAFIFQQEAKANASLLSFVTSIDEIEKQSGIDFFSELEDPIEDVLESKITPKQWRLPEVATRPSRY
ncbi:MAG: DNA/RNA non-specific endonuclease [Thiomicrorhabdus sp.]|nr:DNA/RNA non-specific endonuclease [Thiomicrorhabdus sp.]